MKKNKVRPIALCVFLHKQSILVFQGYDAVKSQYFFRPLGGTIEFHEASRDTVIRELREEINQMIKNVKYLGTLENIFFFQGEPGHEIAMIYSADFVNTEIYEKIDLMGIEGDGEPIIVRWIALDQFRPGNPPGYPPLYPNGLLELIREKL